MFVLWKTSFLLKVGNAKLHIRCMNIFLPCMWTEGRLRTLVLSVTAASQTLTYYVFKRLTDKTNTPLVANKAEYWKLRTALLWLSTVFINARCPSIKRHRFCVCGLGYHIWSCMPHRLQRVRAFVYLHRFQSQRRVFSIQFLQIEDCSYFMANAQGRQLDSMSDKHGWV